MFVAGTPSSNSRAGKVRQAAPTAPHRSAHCGVAFPAAEPSNFRASPLGRFFINHGRKHRRPEAPVWCTSDCLSPLCCDTQVDCSLFLSFISPESDMPAYLVMYLLHTSPLAEQTRAKDKKTCAYRHHGGLATTTERRHQLEVITFPAAASISHACSRGRQKSLFDLHVFSPNLAVYYDTLAGISHSMAVQYASTDMRGYTPTPYRWHSSSQMMDTVTLKAVSWTHGRSQPTLRVKSMDWRTVV